jgi:hypothetical protein
VDDGFWMVLVIGVGSYLGAVALAAAYVRTGVKALRKWSYFPGGFGAMLTFAYFIDGVEWVQKIPAGVGGVIILVVVMLGMFTPEPVARSLLSAGKGGRRKADGKRRAARAIDDGGGIYRSSRASRNDRW